MEEETNLDRGRSLSYQEKGENMIKNNAMESLEVDSSDEDNNVNEASASKDNNKGLSANDVYDEEKMLEKAKEKTVYNKLIKQDLIDYLSNASLNFDYFVSTDVFIYIGDLSDVFRLIRSRNKKNGKLAFSTEDYDGDGFFLEKSGRYSHSKKYIEGLCEKFSYKLCHFETQPLRKEKNKYISSTKPYYVATRFQFNKATRLGVIDFHQMV